MTVVGVVVAISRCGVAAVVTVVIEAKDAVCKLHARGFPFQRVFHFSMFVLRDMIASQLLHLHVCESQS